MRGNHLPSTARGLLLLRLVMGAVFLLSGGRKMLISWLGGVIPIPIVSLSWQTDLPLRLQGWLGAHPSGVIAAIVRDLVLPHGAAFAALLAWCQLLLGALLLVGLFARPAAFAAGLILAALTLASAGNGISEARFYILMGAVATALIIGRSGEIFGLDGWRRERKRGMEF